MAEKVGEVFYDVVLKQEQIQKQLDGLEKKFESTGKTGSKVFKNIGKLLAGGAAIAGLKKLVSAASDAEETFGKFGVVFKDVQEDANKAAANLAKNYNFAKDEAQALLANTADIVSGFGLEGAEALQLSERLNKLAADTSSFSNFQGGAVRASEALTSAVLGNAEAAKNLGIFIKQDDVNARLAAKGLDKLTGNQLLAAKAQESLNIAYEQSKNSLGDSINTATSAANVARRLQNNFRDLTVDIGKEILPAFKELGSAFVDATTDGGGLSGALIKIGKVIGKVVGTLAVLVRGVQLVRAEFDKYLSAVQIATEESKKFGVDSRKAGNLAVLSFETLNKKLDETKGKTDENNQELNKTIRAAIEIKKRYEGAGKGAADALDKLTKSVDSLFGKTEKKAESTSKSFKKPVDAAKVASKELAKLTKDAEKFLSTIGAIGLSESEQIEAIQQERLAKLKEFEAAGVIATQQAADARVAINEDAANQTRELRINQFLAVNSAVGSLLGQLSEINNLAAQNESANLQAKQEKELEILNSRFDTEKRLIEGQVGSRAARDKALKKLDTKRVADTKALEEKQAKDQKKLQRDAAVAQRQLSIFQTLVSIPEAAFAAFKSAQVLPFPASAIVGGALATATTGLGLKKLDLIRKAPLPQLAEGGLISSAPGTGTLAQIGEGFDDELVAPLNNNTFDRLGEGIVQALNKNNEGGTITPNNEGLNIVLNLDLGNEVITKTVQTGLDNREIIVNISNLSAVS